MGLFSKFGKNKQQSPEDSGYYRAADDRAITERARSKRASSADGAGATRSRARKDAPDPVLPEKKRARRRLVGAIALALAERGWDIVVHYRHSEDDADLTALDVEALGRRALLLQCDLSDEAAVRALLQRTSAFGPVTCLVNNAALFEQDDASDFTVSRLDAHMHANLAAPVLLAPSR